MHTAKTQFDGTKHLASRIATAYSESPLSGRDGHERLDSITRNAEYVLHILPSCFI